MRWDALQLNENGLANDGSNFVPDISSNAVKGADISKVMLDALSKNVAALQASQDAITKVWQEAKDAQAAAQALFDAASSDLSIRKLAMEASAGKSAAAETACSNADNVMNTANGALAQATTESQTISASSDKEIAVILQLKGKLQEVQPLVSFACKNCARLTVFTQCSSPMSSCKPPTFRKRCAVESWLFKIL